MEDSNVSSCWSYTSEEILKKQFPLHHACRDGDVENITSLLDRSDSPVNMYEEDTFYGWTPVHWAAYFGKLPCLMKLLEIGANCDSSTHRFNQSPAHLAAFGGNSHCLKWLLHSGSGINRQLACLRRLVSVAQNGEVVSLKTSRFQQTPVHLSSFSGHASCLLWLLQAGADIKQQDYLGETPVHKAARTGSMECVSLLVSQGAKLNIRNYNGHTPSQLAALCGFQECATYLERAIQLQHQAMGVYHELMTPITQSTSPSTTANMTLPTDTQTCNDSTMQGISGGHLQNGLHEMNSNHIGNACDRNSSNDCDTTMDTCGEMDTCDSNSLETQHNGECDEALLNHATDSQYFSFGGKKRFREDNEEESMKRVCREDCEHLERYGDAYNNNVVSSYHAILAVSAEPMRLDNSLDIVKSLHV